MASDSSTNEPKTVLNYNPDTVRAVFGTGQQIIDKLISKIRPDGPVMDDAAKPSDQTEKPLNSSEIMRSQVLANLKNDPDFAQRVNVKSDNLEV